MKTTLYNTLHFGFPKKNKEARLPMMNQVGIKKSTNGKKNPLLTSVIIRNPHNFNSDQPYLQYNQYKIKIQKKFSKENR